MKKLKAYSPKALTDSLRALASELVDTDNDGNAISREMALAKLIWEQALGYQDADGTYRPAAAWAMQFVFERLEGKTPAASTEEHSRIKAADQVRALARKRINDIADKAAT